MKIAVLGTGTVGRTLCAKLSSLGHDVAMGTRDVAALRSRTDRDDAPGAWLDANPDVTPMSFDAAAGHGEIVFVATAGGVTLEALNHAGAANLEGKVVLDVSNPLDFSRGFPPTLSVANDDSLAEQIQRAFPGARVVKTLNTVAAPVMVDPGCVGGGDHAIFVSGNDADAKKTATTVLRDWFGWTDVIDLGDVTTARGVEMWLALWVRLMQAQGTPMFNIKIVGAGGG